MNTQTSILIGSLILSAALVFGGRESPPAPAPGPQVIRLADVLRSGANRLRDAARLADLFAAAADFLQRDGQTRTNWSGKPLPQRITDRAKAYALIAGLGDAAQIDHYDGLAQLIDSQASQVLGDQPGPLDADTRAKLVDMLRGLSAGAREVANGG